MATSAQQARLIRSVPVKERHMLELNWIVPEQKKLYPAMPMSVLSHLLGHEVGD